MWVFAYGSLMADGWEQKHACTSRCHATLPGYSRALDKASSESRGTREHPAPTLRVVPSEGRCHGVAFEFDDQQRTRVLEELLAREGKAFPLREKFIELSDGRQVAALVPIYEGKQIIRRRLLSEIALMAVRAKGKRGSGVDYVRDVARHLLSAGVEDRAVTDLLCEIENVLRNASGDQKSPIDQNS
jgi:glutathione-specific gamma-glutamylcyclotransferase